MYLNESRIVRGLLEKTCVGWPNSEEWPTSALNWFCWTVNSATASFGTVTSGPVTLLLLLSMPRP